RIPPSPPHVALACLGSAPSAHRLSARPKGLDRLPDPYAALSLPRRAPPPPGYFAETSHAADQSLDYESREFDSTTRGRPTAVENAVRRTRIYPSLTCSAGGRSATGAANFLNEGKPPGDFAPRP